MSSSFKDISVSFVDEDKLASVAYDWRRKHELKFGDHFDVVEFLIHTFIPNRRRQTSLNFFDRNTPDDTPAYVTFSPDVINIDRSIWALANALSGYSQFIVGHEIGHLLFHSTLTKNFSSSPESQIKYFENERSAEWQANKFAEHLILPNYIVRQFASVNELIIHTKAWDIIAKSRYSKVFSPKLTRIDENFTDHLCVKCGGFQFKRNGFILKCTACQNESSIFKFVSE